MLILMSLLRTVLFFMTMMLGSVFLCQLLYGDDAVGNLTQLLYGGIFFATPFYLVFDFIATRIKRPVSKLAIARTFCWAIVAGLVVAMFFAYSASRFAG